MPTGSLTCHAVVVALLALAAAAPPGTDAGAHFRRGQELFSEAQDYRSEHRSERQEIARRFRAAAESFVSAWREGAATTEVLTNAANSYYFAGDIGEAVLSYRRALAMAPRNEAARSALEHIRQGLPFQKKVSSVTTLVQSLFFWHDERFFALRLWAFYCFFPAAWVLFAVEVARSRWRWLRALLLPVLPFALLAFGLEYLFRLRRPYATVGVLCLIPALAVLSSLLIDAIVDEPGREAVVLVEVEGKKGNGESYRDSHDAPLPPGIEVRILDRRQGDGRTWLDVELLDGTSAWIPEATVERVLKK